MKLVGFPSVVSAGSRLKKVGLIGGVVGILGAVGLAFAVAAFGGGGGASGSPGHGKPPPPTTTGPPDTPPVSDPWLAYGTDVNPGSAIQFVSAGVGWRLDGQDGAPYLDDNLAAGPGNGAVIMDWPGSSVSSSSDGGASWSTVFSSDTGIWGFDLLSAQVGWVVGVTSLSRTTDGGASWQQMGEPNGQSLVAVDFVSDDVGYGITTDGSVFSSSDGGATWSTVPFAGSAGAVCFTSAQNGYAADQLGNIFVTSDGGQTWAVGQRSPIPTPGSTHSVWAGLSCSGSDASQTVQVVDAGGGSPAEPYVVSQSADQGSSWTVAADASGDPQVPVPPAASPFHQLAGATGGPAHGALLVGFPSSGWGLQIARTRGSGHAPAAVPSLPASSPPPETAGYLVVHGVSFSGSNGWILLNDNAVGPESSPQTESIVLGTTDGGNSWSILQADSPQNPPNQ